MVKIRVGWLRIRRRETINFPSHIGKFSGFIPFVVGGGRTGVYIEEEGGRGSVY